MKHLVILTEIISPYRIPLFNALAEHKAIRPHVIFLAETDPSLRQWHVYKREIRFSYQVLPSLRRSVGTYNALLNWGVIRALEEAQPEVVLCGGYNYLASWQSLLWAGMRGVPFLLWSESTACDLRAGRPWVEFLKSEFLKNCTGFVVPGISSREYLVARGLKESRIFTAPNAVDNDLFRLGARQARLNEAQIRAELALPLRYFLFVGRLVWEKGVFDLLSAYASLDPNLRGAIALLFVGEGPERQRLEEQARLVAPGRLLFAGFVHREQLPAYYALADMLILPSHTEPWGLVVNEAMACGLPVVVSRAAGCVADLVRAGWNGRIVSPGDIAGIGEAMQSLACGTALRHTMGLHSTELIQRYSAEAWAEGITAAVEQVESEH
jgi:glycosyltransferase involved in cell wall biosynthesis